MPSMQVARELVQGVSVGAVHLDLQAYGEGGAASYHLNVQELVQGVNVGSIYRQAEGLRGGSMPSMQVVQDLYRGSALRPFT